MDMATNPVMGDHQILALGDELYLALIDRRPVAPLTERFPGISLEDAYRIQLRMVDRRLEKGEMVVGKKIGVTSRAVQEMLGVYQPDFGQLLSGMMFTQGEGIPVGKLIAPRAEAEVAFYLKRDLMGPGITAEDVLAATEAVVPCFEIVDSRIRDWKIRIQDTVADNASCGVFVLGSQLRDPKGLDLAAAAMVVKKNGQVVSKSTGASVQGSPLNSVAWLANTLSALGIPFRAGEVILSGSQSPLFPAVAGDRFECTVEGLGSCSVHFV